MQPPSAAGAVVLLLSAFHAGAAPPPDPFAECEAKVRAQPDSGWSYYCFHLVARTRSLFDEAARRLETHLARGPRNDWIRLSLASVEADRGRDRAETLFRDAAEGFAESKQAIGESLARVRLAYFLMRRGRLPEAEAEAARAEAVAQKTGDRGGEVNAHITQAWVAYHQEDYGRAWLLLTGVESDLFPKGMTYLQSDWLSAMGATCWAIGRTDEAMSCYRRQADLLHGSGDLFEEAVARDNLVLLAGAGQLDSRERLSLARDALAIAVAGRNRSAEASAHFYLADLTEGSDRLEHARRSLALAREIKDQSRIFMGMRVLSSVLKDESPDDAYRLIGEAIDLARRTGFPAEAARNRAVQSSMRWETGPRDRAIDDSLACLDSIETTRNLQPDAVIRARRFSQWATPYYALSGHLLEGHLLDPGSGVSDGDRDLAFSTIERMRSRVLLDELDASQAAPRLVPKGALATRRAAVLEEIVQVQRRLVDPALPETERTDLLKELERLELQEASLREEMTRENPAFGALRSPSFPSLENVREALEQDEALLSFQLYERLGGDGRSFLGGSWVFVLTRDAVRLHRIPDRGEMHEPIAVFLGLFQRRDASESEGAARLYGLLLKDALDGLPARIRRLVLVPDANLHRLPFGALRRAPSEPPLATRYEISVTPSATLWLRLRRNARAPAGAPALALADPKLPSSAASSGKAEQAERAWALTTASQLPPLSSARKEARFLVRTLGGGSRLLVGEEASEDRVKTTKLREFELLHFATHALLDEEHLERSAILLAPGSPREDGLLQIREIVTLDLRGQVVVLSACRSASGALLNGEGVMGLGRAFFQAGAHAVVGSLWPLRDDDAEALFTTFYRRLGNGLSIASALAEAQRERIGAGAPSAAWAGVVVLGDGSRVPLPGGRRRTLPPFWLLAGLLPVIALAVAGLVWLMKRRG